MKFTQKYLRIAAATIGLVLLNSCEENSVLRVAYPNDITFNEVTLDRFTYEIPTAPFTAGDNESGVITVNVTGSGDNYSGFALSNKNFRSFPWNLSPDFAPVGGLTAAEEQEEINTTAFSVYTDEPNKTENYLVGNTTGDNAFFTLETPSTVAHVLIANTSYTYLLADYGSVYSDDYESDTQSYLIDGGKTKNTNIENPDTDLYGRFWLPAPDGYEAVWLRGYETLERRKVAEPAGEAAGLAVVPAAEAAGEVARTAALAEIPALTPEEVQDAYDDAYDDVYYAAYDAAYDAAFDSVHKGFVKLTIEGFLSGSSTGTVEWYLAVNEEVDALNPEHEYILSDWQKVDLTSLGSVDKVLFNVSSDYVHADGSMVYAPMFCLDGIRLE